MKFVATAIAIFTLTIATWFSSPYLAVYQVVGAAQDGDSKRLSDYIDLLSVKANIGATLKGQIDQGIIEAIRKSSPLGTLSLMAAERAIDTVIEKIVNPNMVGKLLRGQKLAVLTRTEPTIKSETTKPKVTWEYERDYDHFVMNVQSRVDPEARTRFVFFRNGWIGEWRIVAVEFTNIKDIVALLE